MLKYTKFPYITTLYPVDKYVDTVDCNNYVNFNQKALGFTMFSRQRTIQTRLKRKSAIINRSSDNLPTAKVLTKALIFCKI